MKTMLKSTQVFSLLQFKYKWNKTKIIDCPFCHSFSQSFFVNDSSAIQTNNDIPRRFIVYDKKNRV